MHFISEDIINQVAAKLDEQADQYKDIFKQFSSEQPAIVAYLFSDSFTILLLQEREYLLYLSLILWASVKEKIPGLGQVAPESIASAEERNYAILDGLTSRDFRERLDSFFQNYPQEDLLAFVEDALSDEEEVELTKTGREPMFIALKSMIDCYFMV